MDFQPIDELIRHRRSSFVRQFIAGKQVPDEIIERILENACYAPNHKLTEPWRFVVYTGSGLKQLAEQQAAVYKEHAGSSFKQNKYEQLLTAPLECSHIIAIGCKRHPGLLPEMEEVAAVACAVQNIYLSVAAHGLGGYWSTGGITFMEPAKALVGLEEKDVFMGFFYIGYVHTASPQRRPKMEEKVKWVR